MLTKRLKCLFSYMNKKRSFTRTTGPILTFWSMCNQSRGKNRESNVLRTFPRSPKDKTDWLRTKIVQNITNCFDPVNFRRRQFHDEPNRRFNCRLNQIAIRRHSNADDKSSTNNQHGPRISTSEGERSEWNCTDGARRNRSRWTKADLYSWRGGNCLSPPRSIAPTVFK